MPLSPIHLIDALLEGDQTRAVSESKQLRSEGFMLEQIVTEGIEVAMNRLDDKCTVEQFNLLEIMLVGRATMAVIRELYPSGTYPPATKGSIVIGSLEGDIHDLGKGILEMVLLAKGYRVSDCGKDCPVDRLIDRAEADQATAICVSGLITSVIPQVKQIRELCTSRGLTNVRLLAGGAALKQDSARNLNVDFVAETAFDGARYLDRFSQGGGGPDEQL